MKWNEMSRLIVSRTTYLLTVLLVLGRAQVSKAQSVPNVYEYYVDGTSTAPMTLWPTSVGYCYLGSILVGSSSTDKVNVFSSGGNWMLSASGANKDSSVFGVANCVPWPAGFSEVDSQNTQWTSAPGINLTQNDHFCSISGITYDGSPGIQNPQPSVRGYPTSNTLAQLFETVATDTSTAHKVASSCIAPAGTSRFFTGSGGTLTTFLGNAGTEPVLTGPGTTGPATICGLLNIQANSGGPMSVEIYPIASLSEWVMGAIGEGSNNFATAACISYPGPVVQMNAGGPEIDQNPPTPGPTWAIDALSGGNTINHPDTIDVSHATRPAPTTVYQTARIGNFTYTFTGYTPNTSHTVRLHFAETVHTAAGQREFNVKLNGTQVLTNFDIFAVAGAKDRANVQQFTTNANASGQIVIQFVTVIDNSLVSGIEIQ